MSQNNTFVKFIIHDANGQPQMVKVVPNKSNTVKIATAQGNSKSPVYKAVNNIQCTTKPVLVKVESALSNIAETRIKREISEAIEFQATEKQPLVELDFIDVPESIDRQLKTLTTSISETRPMSYTSKKRPCNDGDPQPEYTTKRRKHADKVGKGLRHFSMKVCEKVRTKGFTSYNEVADELVAEFAAGMHGTADSQQYDQKNIRRRVYDALNVLMAMNIISKEKKEIRWLGLPTNSLQECAALQRERRARRARVADKAQQLQELLLQHISFKSLIERNKHSEEKGVKPSPSSAIHLPFIVVNTSDKALIDCSISNDKTEYMFNFNKRFQIHDDIDILKRMGLLFGLDKGECSEEDVQKIKNMVPKSLEQYVERMGRGDTDIADLSEEAEDGSDDEIEEESFKVEGDVEEPEECEGNGSSDDSGSDVDV